MNKMPMNRRIRVLVAAGQAFRMQCAASLEIDGLVEVMEASDAEHAIRRAQVKRRPDLIVVGPALHDRSGWECLVGLKSDAKTKDIPVVLFAEGHEPTPRLIKEFLNASGIDNVACVFKPFDQFVLAQRIQDLALRNGRSPEYPGVQVVAPPETINKPAALSHSS